MVGRTGPLQISELGYEPGRLAVYPLLAVLTAWQQGEAPSRPSGYRQPFRRLPSSPYSLTSLPAGSEVTAAQARHYLPTARAFAGRDCGAVLAGPCPSP